jgi:hypothetical protein
MHESFSPLQGFETFILNIFIISNNIMYYTYRAKRISSATATHLSAIDDKVNSHLLKMLLATTATHFFSFALPMLIALTYTFIENKFLFNFDKTPS